MPPPPAEIPLQALASGSSNIVVPLQVLPSRQPEPASNIVVSSQVLASGQPELSSNIVVPSNPPVLGLTPIPSPSTGEGFAAWREKVKSLTPQQRKEFLAHKRDDLSAYLREFEGIAQSQGGRRTHRIAAKVRPLWGFSKYLSSVASDQWLSQLDPSHSSLILGGVSYLLSLSGQFLAYYDDVLSCLGDMLERLPVVEKVELLHADKPDPDLCDAAVNICVDVLQFCIQASELFVKKNGRVRSSGRLFLASIGGSFTDKFGDVRRDFDRHVQLFDTCAQIAIARKQLEFRRDWDTRNKAEDETAVLRAERDRRMELNESAKDQGTYSLACLPFMLEQLTDTPLEARRAAILKRIPGVSLQSVQDNRLEACLVGTGQWLLHHPTFRQWMDSPTPRLLWVHGKHGCGKSHLAAIAIDHLAKSQVHASDAALAYIYCNPVDASRALRNSGTSHANSAEIDLDELIGTLLQQLLQYFPVSESLPSLERAPRSTSDSRPSRDQMKTAIVDVLAKLPRAFVVIDGLDECYKLGNQSFERFCDFIASLAGRILVFSRPNYPEIDKALCGALSLPVDCGANSEDIGLFVNEKMSRVKISATILEELSSKLVSRADGMFLWVGLVSGTLQSERSVRGLREAIENLPEGLDTVYEWSMERIFRQSRAVRERAFNLLLWIANANRMLSQEEMMEALAVKPGMADLDEETRLVNDDGFVGECADLIVLRHGHYQLLHTSLQEYLHSVTTANKSTSPAVMCYTEMQRRSEYLMAGTCLTYLNFKTFQRGPLSTAMESDRFMNDNPFFDYASLNWGFHMRPGWKECEVNRANVIELAELIQLAEPAALAKLVDLPQLLDAAELTDSERAERAGLADLAVRLVSSEPARDICMQHILRPAYWVIGPPHRRIYRPFPFRHGSTALHILAFFGLTRLAQESKSFWASIHQEDGYGNYPFKYAMMMGQSNMCHFLMSLSEGWSVGRPVFWSKSKDALPCAAALDCPLLLKRLLNCGLDPNAPTGTWDPPLYEAARRGRQNASETLIAAGAGVNVMSQERETPLTLATARDDKDMVALLIAKGADVNVKSGPRGQTPLHIAAAMGNLDIARLLLEHGCDVNSVDHEKITPVFRAAWRGNFELVKVLAFAYQADLGDKHFDGIETSNLLPTAVASGNCELVNLLLDLGLQPTINPATKYNLLNAAVYSTNMLKMVLQRFPTVDRRAIAVCGKTPLHSAASKGPLEAMRYLLELDPSLAAVCTPLAGLPLHSAISGNRLECVKHLLTPENINAKGPRGRTPLILAASRGHLALVDLLIRRDAGVDDADAHGSTALLAAAKNGHLPVVDCLVKHGADFNKVDNDGQGLLLWLLAEGQFSAAECLLLRSGIQVDLVTTSGYTPLLAAAKRNCTAVAARLLDLGADHARRRDGYTAFLHAVQYQRTATTELFEQRRLADYHAVNGDGASVIHWAARTDNLPLLKRALSANEALGLATDVTGADLLSDAASYNSKCTIRFLLGAGFSPDGPQQHCLGCSPLIRAARFGRVVCAKLLIKARVDVKIVSGAPWHRNAGHWAAAHGWPRTTAALLHAGVDFVARDALGYSVADYARRNTNVWRRTKQYYKEHPSHDSSVSDDHHPEPRGDIRRILRKTILDCANALLQLDRGLPDDTECQQSNANPPSQVAKTQFLRQHYLACLAMALDRFCHFSPGDDPREEARGSSEADNSKRENPLEDSCLCTHEVVRAPSISIERIWWKHCDLCCVDLDEAFSKCKSCEDTFICGDCHSDYIKHGCTAPESFHALDRINKDVIPMEVALDPLRGNIKLLVESVVSRPELEEWFLRCQTIFKKWSTTYTKYAPRKIKPFDGDQGQTFIAVITRAISLREESLNEDRFTNVRTSERPQWRTESLDELTHDRWIVLSNELMDNCLWFNERYPYLAGERVHPQYRNLEGHDFVQIPAFSGLTEGQKAMFDSDKRLKDEFFRDILHRYSPPPDPSGATDPEPGDEDAANRPPSASDNPPEQPPQSQIAFCQDGKTSNAPPSTPLCIGTAAGRDNEAEPGDSGGEKPCQPDGEADEPGNGDEDDDGENDDDESDDDESDDDESDDYDDYDDDSNDSNDSEAADELDQDHLSEAPPATYPELIASQLVTLLNSDNPQRHALRVRAYISRIAKRIKPWPPVQAPRLRLDDVTDHSSGAMW